MEAVCRFCKEAPDGDKACFLGLKRERCNKPKCVLAWEAEMRREWNRDQERRRQMARDISASRKRKRRRRVA